MPPLARQLHHQAVLVLKVGHLADGAVFILVELLPVDAVQRVHELLAHALEPRRGVVDVVLETRDELLQEVPVVRGGGRVVQGEQLLLEEPEESGCVDGSGRRMGVLLGSLGAGGGADLVEEGEEGRHVNAAGAAGFGEAHSMFNYFI